MTSATVSLYANGKPTPLAVETAEPLALDKECDRCKLNCKSVRSPCLAPCGAAGGLLVVGEAPGRNEDASGKPFIGASGNLLRQTMGDRWTGPVLVDNALRCAPGNTTIRPKMLNECRGYLSSTIRDAQPTRIICLGARAAFAVAGRSVAPFSARRAYTFMSDGTPVIFVLHPAAALRNRFIRQWFVDDLQWALSTKLRVPDFGASAVVVSSAAEADACLDVARRAPWSSFDVETSGEMWRESFEIISVAVCPQGSANAFVWGGAALKDAATREPLFRWLHDKSAEKIGQNVKYDQLACRDALGIEVRGVVGDTRLWRKLLEPDAGGALDGMAELVGMGGIKSETQAHMKKIVATLKRNLTKLADGKLNGGDLYPGIDHGTAMWLQRGVPPERFQYKLLGAEQLTRYNARDAVATTALGEHLGEQLASEPQLHRVWSRIVRPASLALERVEAWGVGVDTDALRRFGDHLDARITAAEVELQVFPDMNWQSAPQVRALLFEELKLPVVDTTPTGAPSTKATVLEALRNKHPIVAALLDYRTMMKFKGTYADGMWQHIRSDGRIHPNIKLDGARSGRTSCTDPNLQNIPRKDSPEGKMARDCFVAAPGRVLIELDYSQLELRVAAMLSGDPLMRAIFDEGVDYHQRTAELISQQAWGIEPDAVESKHRTQAKTVNFALLYGMSDKALAAKLGIRVGQAARVRDGILGKFRVLAKWSRTKLSETRRSGEAWTWWDGERARRRPLWRIADQDSETKSRAENGAVNTPVQGTASDYCVRSLAECVTWIVEDGIEDLVHLVLPVHDSLMFDVVEEMAEETLAVARAIMQSWPSAGVPLNVDAKIGRSWGSLEDV